MDSFELGLKGGLGDGRLLYDLAAYRYTYTNFQTAVPGTIRPLTSNGGNATAHGLEASLIGRLSEAVSGFANYGWTHARFDDKDDDGQPQLLAGNHFRLTPEHTLALGLDVRLPLGAHEFFLRPNYTWRSKVYFEDINNDDFPGLDQGAYGLLNLDLGVKFANRWEVQAWGSNLSGQKYLIDAGNTGQQLGLPTYIVGAPRMYGLRVAYGFGQ